MNTITILVGENINDLWFQQGGSSVLGLHVEEGYCSKWIYNHESTVRKCPEDGKHPKVYKEWLLKDVDYVLKHWNYIIATNSSNTIDILCRLAYDGVIRPEQLIIHGLNEKNTETIFTSTLDKDKFYLLNWPYGFMDID